MTPARPIALVSGLALAAALLSGCSAVNAVVAVQSKAEGCLQISSQLKAVGASMTSKLSELKSDPKGAAAAIAKDTRTFSTAAGKVKNSDVKSVAGKAAIQLTRFSDDLTSLANSPTQAAETKLQADLTPLQTALKKIDTTCKL